MELYTGQRVKKVISFDPKGYSSVRGTVVGAVYWGGGIQNWYYHVIFDDGRVEESGACMFEPCHD